MHRILVFSAIIVLARTATADVSFERTETREECNHYVATRQPLFGDLHVHTSYSFDSYVSSQRNDPWDAYRYARGEPIFVPDADGDPTVIARIGRPLDFTAVTDHAEFLGAMNVCTEDASRAGYWWPHCAMTRASEFWVQLMAANSWTKLGGQLDDGPVQSPACLLSDCRGAGADVWQRIQQAAEDHYDRTSACSFTTFVGYEFTDAPNQRNMHRNVIFRNANVTEMPISVYDVGRSNFTGLWQELRSQCLDTENGCDVLAIPHNPNLSGGLMFRDPKTPRELADRLALEPVVEITQHKGSSECRFDRLAGRGLFTEDELCDFEQVVSDNLTMLGSVHGRVRTSDAAAVPIDEFGKRNMLRNVLKAGLELEQQLGANPFVMGFIGSTDTHTATPGATEEDNYVGHLGRRDSEYRNVQDHFFSNPGGHAVVWAEENSRDSIFAAIRRKETYATSGTRPVVRFFAGPAINENLCQSTDMIDEAYARGVPMGSEFHLGQDAGEPKFLLSALKDPGTAVSGGTDLQRIQVIKGWVDAEGNAHEKVFDVAGDADNGASVDSESCATTGTGFSQLCTVWQDPDFDRSQNAFYYARVLENPTCRWSTLQCQAAGVNPLADNCSAQAAAASQVARESGAEGEAWEKCCIDPASEPFYSPIIQERAWTSPIWYRSEKSP